MLKKYLAYSSVLAIFSEAIQYHFIIDLKFFYIIVLTNSILLLGLNNFKINLSHLVLLLLFAIHGMFGVAIIPYPLTDLASQLIGISICSIFFYNLVRYFGVSALYEIYVKIAYYIVVLALVMFILGISFKDSDRLHGILLEPSRFVIIILPSVYYYYNKKKYVKFSIIIIALILSQSSIGYLGLLLLLILPNLKLKYFKYLLRFSPLIILSIYFLSQNENFQIRYNETIDSLQVFRTRTFEGYKTSTSGDTYQGYQINTSSYALLSNAYVAFNNFLDHPLGSGLGSHESMHDIYIQDLEIPYNIEANESIGLNKADANSLFLRILSDFGVIGIIMIFWFSTYVVKALKFEPENAIIIYGFVVYFILKLLRQGHYFPPEFYFFLFLFLFHFKDVKRGYESFIYKL